VMCVRNPTSRAASEIHGKSYVCSDVSFRGNHEPEDGVPLPATGGAFTSSSATQDAHWSLLRSAGMEFNEATGT
jgi:hypothetical protein